MTGSRRIEFWPDYAGALLHEAGRQVPLAALPLPRDVVDRAAAWVARYDDDKLLDGPSRDDLWIAEGRNLYEILRALLAARGIELFDWEGLWAQQGQP